MGDGAINSSGYGLGATLTWQGKVGFYLDAQANLTLYEGNLSSTTSGIDGLGYAVGLEMGQEIALGPKLVDHATGTVDLFSGRL